VNFDLTGNLEKGTNGHVQFSGSIAAQSDKFDFDPNPWGQRDPGGFPYSKEISTRIGATLCANEAGTVTPRRLLNESSRARLA